MTLNIDFTKLKTSWTKYDIVQVMDVVASEERIERYKKKKIGIDEPILRSFLGIKTLYDPTPSYWIDIQSYPEEKKLFALLAVLFTHGVIVEWFAENYSIGYMGGVFLAESGKYHTNIRSALVESGAARPNYRRAAEVPYDFSPVFKNGEVGKLFKQVLEERLARLAKRKLNNEEFYVASFANKFPSALGLTEAQYNLWLEGTSLVKDTFKDTFLLTPEEFKTKFYEYVTQELIKRDIDFTYDFRYDKGFYLRKKTRFSTIKNFSDRIEVSNFYFRQLNSDIIRVRYEEILLADPDIPKVGNDILRLFQHLFSLDFEEIVADSAFIDINKSLVENYITKIDAVEINNFYSIKNLRMENLGFANEIYLLGENGDGKSLILMAIYLAFNQFFITEKTEQEKTGKIKDLIQDNKELILLGKDASGEIYGRRKSRYLNQFFAYGSHRGRYNTDSADKYGFMTLFDGDQVLIHPVSWLKDKKLFELQNEQKSNGSDVDPVSTVQLSVASLQEILYEVLEKNVTIKINGSDVCFVEKGSTLRFDQLSEGYKSIIVFVCDLIFHLAEKQPYAKATKDFEGIVLVDEIDLHLHPKWQFVVVKKLRSIFPNIQFIFSTHSPVIIQGASEDSIIYRVYRNSSDGQTHLSDAYYRKNLDHLMINSLVTSPLFDMANARLNPDDVNSDTSDSYVLYKLNKKITEELALRKKAGQEFISEQEIDQLINEVITKESKEHDKS